MEACAKQKCHYPQENAPFNDFPFYRFFLFHFLPTQIQSAIFARFSLTACDIKYIPTFKHSNIND